MDLLLIVLLLCVLKTSNIFGQTAFEIEPTDSTSAIVVCYVEILGNFESRTSANEKGYKKITKVHSTVSKVEKRVQTFLSDTDDYCLKVEPVPVLGAYWNFTSPPSGNKVKTYFIRRKYDDGWILCFTNVPPGPFTITKIQTQEEKNSWECKSCISVNCKINVLPGKVNYMGAFQVKYGFKDQWIGKSEEWGEVLFQNLYSSTSGPQDVEIIQLNIPLEVNIIDEIMGFAEGAWEEMFEKYYEDISN